MPADRTYIIPDNCKVEGTLIPTEFSPPAECLGDGAWDPADPLLCTNQEHQHPHKFTTAIGSAVTAVQAPFFAAYAPGSIVALRAKMDVAPTLGAKVIIDFKKNGTSILSAAFEYTSATVARTGAVLATITSGQEDYVAGDFFSVHVTVTAPSGVQGQGLLVECVVREEAGS